MTEISLYFLKVSRADEPPMPQQALKKLPAPSDKTKLVNAWMKAAHSYRNKKTVATANDLRRMIEASAYKEIVAVKETFGNIGVISVALPEPRKKEILDFLMTHREIEKRTIGSNSYKQPKPKKTA